MATTALAVPGPLSVVTIADRRVDRPAWRTMLGWPEAGDEHVPFAAANAHQRNASAAHLDDAVARAARPVLLVAEGASCFAAAWWARLSPSSYVERVAGALLFNPISEDEREVADNMRTFASPRSVLPFPSILLDRDPVSDRLRTIANDWGSRLADRGDLVRLAAPRVSPWRQAQRMIERYTAAVVKRDIRTTRERLR
ncbi:hypothetical protein D1610_15520 [Sphingomonas gilva]|uniref:Alpha/beta hydrolase n=1 Tax=Sphingomonas gilva TaxID=2305907 RepID=A0A396RJX7_9SPHN|nr:alpha/beta hydrolase [Sphingomonas gilva]RHW16498.1 hypothetical protein D1610_15520 [Sphingomonas gilva]